MKAFTLYLDQPDYPALLKEIHDPPVQMYGVGEAGVLAEPCVGIVGTRRCTTYGENQAFEIAKALARAGVCIVSGLAYGIDAAAHKGALAGGGHTVAVIAQPLDELRPIAHRSLAREIVEKGGLILSEKQSGQPMYKSDYLVRNRVISGLSNGVLVVEAGARSGALNTANHALEQNRDIMAIPGRLTDKASAGTNALIARGARLVTCPKDIADFMEVDLFKTEALALKGFQKELFEKLLCNAMSMAELSEFFPKQLAELYTALGELELAGLIKRFKNGRYTAGG